MLEQQRNEQPTDTATAIEVFFTKILR